MRVIEIDKLTKFYGQARGIIDVSFSVEEGEIFGFIGPNGAGKSTTIRTLLGLIYPTSGKARIFGKDCIEHGPEVKREIGYVPSEVFYYERMKVIELLRYSASFYKKDCEKRIHELAERMDLDLKRKIEDLSFGNRHKVGIVQGLLHSPRLIILDEPTSGLDPLIQQSFFALLREENQKGASILFSSHVLSEVQRLCQRVAIIKEGRIIRVDSIEALTATSYRRVRLEALSDLAGYFQFPGVSSLDRSDKVISFMYGGDINLLMSKLAGIEIASVWIEEPGLEEIFLHYYEKGGPGNEHVSA